MQKGVKVGLILPSLDASQATFNSIHAGNALVMGNPLQQVFAFTETVTAPCLQPLFPVLNVSKTRSFDGVLISGDIRTTVMASNSLQARHRIFYVWDLEWLRRGKGDFVQNMLAFRHPSIKLIARSLSHKKMIERYCNKEVSAVIPWFDLGMIYRLTE